MLNLLKRLIPILTNYVIFVTITPKYAFQLVDLTFQLASSLVSDVYLTGFEYPIEYDWTIEQQVAQKGYQFESYKILTEDGYVLTIFRIPGRLGEPEMENVRK